MKRLIAGTALALIAGSALAQQTTNPPAGSTPPADAAGSAGTGAGQLFLPTAEADAIYASDLIGMEVYSSAADFEGSYTDDRAVPQADLSQWDDIGEVNDVVMSPEGETLGVLVDVGGFLGMGARTVALDMSQLHLLRDETNRRFVAVNSTREQLESAPEYERPNPEPVTAAAPGAGGAGMMGATDPTAPGAGGTGMTGATAPAAPGAAGTGTMGASDPIAPGATGTGTMGAADTAADTRPAFEREGFMTANYDSLTADQLQGAAVYDAEDQNIGDVQDLVVSSDGKIERAIVDVGGFLGMGERRVALSFDEMQVMTNNDASEVRVYIDESRQELEQRPEYNE